LEPLCKENVFERLLESGLNPYYEFEGRTLVDLVNERVGGTMYVYDKSYVTPLKTLCEKYKRDPIDHTIVMYWKKSKTETVPLTIEDIRKHASFNIAHTLT
jgi:hypothetical protein